MKSTLLALGSCCAAIVACHSGGGTGAPTAPSALVSSNTNPVPAPASTTVAPSGKFEGEIVLDVRNGSGPKVPSSVTFDVRGDQVRYEPASTTVRAVYNLGDAHAYVISDSKKAYDELDTNARSAAAPVRVKLQRSTRQEKIAGLSCEDWTLDDGVEQADVCAAKDIAFFDPGADAKPGDAEPSWARAMTMQKAFPLSVVVHDRSGKEEYRAEAFEVRWKPVDEAAFQLPTGFKRSDLSAEMKVASLP